MEPTSERVKQDILNFPRIVLKITKGCVVPDEFLMHGKRYARANGKRNCKVKPRARQRKSTLTSRFARPDDEQALQYLNDDENPQPSDEGENRVSQLETTMVMTEEAMNQEDEEREADVEPERDDETEDVIGCYS